MRTIAILTTATLAACGGGGGGAPGGGASPGSVMPAVSSGDAALAFLRAAADSNLTRMAELWGSANGSAAQTNHPPDYSRRIFVMQAYLRSDSSRVVGQAAVPGDDGRRTVTVAIWRSGCMRQLPFTMVRTRDGTWIVNEVNLALAGNPARPCEAGEPPGN